MQKLLSNITIGLTVLTLAATPVLAGNGKGNGGGSSDSSSSSSSSRSGKSSGSETRGKTNKGAETSAANKGGLRGSLAKELKSLNAAHASPTALANADPDSKLGRLYIYQQTGGLTLAEIAALNAARQEVAALETMSTSAIMVGFDADGDGVLSDEEQATYEANLERARQSYTDLTAAHGDAYAALAGLRDSDEALTLSNSALNELNRLLGL